jgi:wyosine [tRNA(Phe)-imidazoG37] synthetase (radical SAM superfamily)
VPSDREKAQPSKYTYGPVPSRRLGYSLGIDIIPHKICTFDCIYCQLGRTTDKTLIRKEYTPVEPILKDVNSVLTINQRIDHVTFSGSGEPTLHKNIGYLIDELKKLTKIPIAVLTNGSLLYTPEVRNDLKNADVVLPTLCTADQGVFRKIHRSHAQLNISAIIEGYIEFRKIYQGKIWLELMLVRGINDRLAQIEDMMDVIRKINPDKIHLNTVVRPPSEEYAQPVPMAGLEKIRSVMGEKCEIIVDFKPGVVGETHSERLEGIAAMIARRPVTMDDLVNASGLHKNQILKYIQMLLAQGRIEISRHGQKDYYKSTRGSDEGT